MTKSFRNVLNYYKGAGGTKAGVSEALHLGEPFSKLNASDKKQFIASWFQKCGAKLDFGALMRAELMSCTSTTHSSKQGYMYPSEVAKERACKLTSSQTMPPSTRHSWKRCRGSKRLLVLTLWTCKYWFSSAKAEETKLVNTARDVMGKTANQAPSSKQGAGFLRTVPSLLPTTPS
eukprot:1337721-Amphidinium_carterae.2